MCHITYVIKTSKYAHIYAPHISGHSIANELELTRYVGGREYGFWSSGKLFDCTMEFE